MQSLFLSFGFHHVVFLSLLAHQKSFHARFTGCTHTDQQQLTQWRKRSLNHIITCSASELDQTAQSTMSSAVKYYSINPPLQCGQAEAPEWHIAEIYLKQKKFQSCTTYKPLHDSSLSFIQLMVGSLNTLCIVGGIVTYVGRTCKLNTNPGIRPGGFLLWDETANHYTASA